MDFITHSQPEKAAHSTIGGKAKNLFRLKALGLPVPEWVVIPQEELAKLVPEAIQKGEPEKIQVFIQSLTLPLVFLEQIIQQFPPDTFFAVRSSALDEDGADFSFAGQFESHLYVTPARLEEIIKKVWCSAFTARVYEYRRNNKLKPLFGIAVIIQVLVNADVAGVAFGMNPATGDRRSKIISAVYGLGEGLVSGELNSDNYSFKDNRVIPDIADKTHRFIPLPGTAGGIHKVEVDAAMRKLPCLNDEQVRALAAILDQCREIYGRPQDMEFAISQHKIFLLQSRPITNLHKIADPGGEYILWDN
ncbi:MAG TPA: PEP/pyruvate-binding domain-containing protein, partial [Bacteroidia bacterium]|nr:PEP/pyruvate-binding domain-containing protein [Bacteroidia bacterium]